MKFTRIQKQEALKNLQNNVQDFVLSNETTEEIEKLMEEERIAQDLQAEKEAESLPYSRARYHKCKECEHFLKPVLVCKLCSL